MNHYSKNRELNDNMMNLFILDLLCNNERNKYNAVGLIEFMTTTTHPLLQNSLDTLENVSCDQHVLNDYSFQINIENTPFNLIFVIATPY